MLRLVAGVVSGACFWHIWLTARETAALAISNILNPAYFSHFTHGERVCETVSVEITCINERPVDAVHRLCDSGKIFEQNLDTFDTLDRQGLRACAIGDAVAAFEEAVNGGHSLRAGCADDKNELCCRHENYFGAGTVG
ncbi:hypothetical protein B0H14DRAFT_2942879 [Mycena olivaceomarginata]|nr:hypothetical protein B0H14DRAFT_2942879 [Mycena olivaceomarginata]